MFVGGGSLKKVKTLCVKKTNGDTVKHVGPIILCTIFGRFVVLAGDLKLSKHDAILLRN